MLGDVSEFAKALEPLIRKIVEERTKNALRVERYEVSTAANGTVMGVRQPYGTEIFLPYSQEVASATVGTAVLVLWRGSLSTAKVWCFGNGPIGAEGGGTFTETDPTVPSWAKASSKPSYTASEVGAIAAPSSPASGAFLVYNGSAWTAQTLATWQGGNY